MITMNADINKTLLLTLVYSEYISECIT